MYSMEVLGGFCVGKEMSSTMAASGSKCMMKKEAFLGPSFGLSRRMKYGRSFNGCRCTLDSKSVGGDVFSVTPSHKFDVDYLGEKTKGDFNVKFEHLEAFGMFHPSQTLPFYPAFFIFLFVVFVSRHFAV